MTQPQQIPPSVDASIPPADLAEVQDGVLSLDELLRNARGLVNNEPGREALYDGARDRLLAIVRGESDPELDSAPLRDMLARIAALARAYGPPSEDPFLVLAVRCDTLAEVAADAAQVDQAYPLERLRGQAHCATVLDRLFRAGGGMALDALRSELRLKPANATRVMKLLEKVRLIKRERAGLGVAIRLTKLGHATATRWASPDSEGSVLTMKPLSGMPPGIDRWSASESALPERRRPAA